MGSTTEPGKPLFDLAELTRRVGGDTELAHDVLVAVIDDSRRLMVDIESAAAARDSRALRHAAHTMKGCVANVAAIELAARAAELEECAAKSDLTVCAPLVAPLRALFERVHDGLAAAAKR